MNEQFVYIKLVTGETLMALKEAEDSSTLTLKFPMLVKMHLINSREGRVSEQVTAGPYSLFIDNSILSVQKHHIVFNSQLSQRAIPHYIHLVKDHEGITLDYVEEKLQWDDQQLFDEALEDLADIEDVKAAIAQLKSIAQEEAEDIEEEKIYIEGNETLH